jgi:transposase InsO family protein
MPTTAKEREGAADRAARLRLKWIEAHRELGDAGAVCRRFGISRPTLRKWLRRYDAEGKAGLRERSRRPRRSPARKVGPAEEELILGLRRDRRLGVKRLRVELRRLHGLRLSPSVIHKVLVRHDLGALPRRARRRHKPKRYSRPVPGDRVQIDNCKIRPGLWQFTAIDDCSRYLVVGLARRPSAAAALAFLEQVLDEVPFPIQRVQTDRGAEFFAEKVQRRLMAETIRFRPIPPRSPHLNGKVERAQRTVLEEFWASIDTRAPGIGDQLAVWVHHYNWDRAHEALGGLCPIDRVCERADKTPIWAEVDAAYDAARERIQVREYAVEMALRRLK